MPRIFFFRNLITHYLTFHNNCLRDCSLERMYTLPDCSVQREINETGDETLLIDSARSDYLTINLFFDSEKSFIHPELLLWYASIKLLSDQINYGVSHTIPCNIWYDSRKKKREVIFANRCFVNPFSLMYPT